MPLFLWWLQGIGQKVVEAVRGGFLVRVATPSWDVDPEWGVTVKRGPRRNEWDPRDPQGVAAALGVDGAAVSPYTK